MQDDLLRVFLGQKLGLVVGALAVLYLKIIDTTITLKLEYIWIRNSMTSYSLVKTLDCFSVFSISYRILISPSTASGIMLISGLGGSGLCASGLYGFLAISYLNILEKVSLNLEMASFLMTLVNSQLRDLTRNYLNLKLL